MKKIFHYKETQFNILIKSNHFTPNAISFLGKLFGPPLIHSTTRDARNNHPQVHVCAYLTLMQFILDMHRWPQYCFCVSNLITTLYSKFFSIPEGVQLFTEYVNSFCCLKRKKCAFGVLNIEMLVLFEHRVEE